MSDKKIKITHVTRFAKPHNGGIESFIDMFNTCVYGAGTEIEVLCNSNDVEPSTDEKGVFYNRTKYFFNFIANSISLDYILKLSKVDTDVIMYHMPCIFAVIAHFLARPKYKKMIVCYHSDIIGYDKVMKPFWYIFNKFLKQADILHVQSPQMVDNSMVRNFKEKAVMIPYLINTDVSFNEENVNKIRAAADNKKILFALGRHVKYKGFSYLIEAMKNVENAVLMLGGKGPLTEEFKTYIADNNLSDKVKLLGRIADEELDDYYEAADIFVLPSILMSETFAVVQLEAMKHSKPVINTMLNTGVNYVSLDRETGLTVEPENVDQLSSAINELVNNDELRLQYGRGARKRAERIFDLNTVKKEYINLIIGNK